VTALRLLLFRAGGQVFAVEAGAVREILPSSPPTRIPGAPDAVRGLINVRGLLVTVIDAARAIGTGTASAQTGGSIILVERGGVGRGGPAARPVGLAVDDVLDLVTVPTASLDDQASLPGVRPDLVRAVGSAGGLPFVQLATDVLLDPLLP
jgi:purine-binding chemotaxis protein CheW